MNKITIEITSKGWKTRIDLNGKTFTDEHVLTAFGAKSINEAQEYNEELDERLVEALEMLNAYDVALAIKKSQVTNY